MKGFAAITTRRSSWRPISPLMNLEMKESEDISITSRKNNLHKKNWGLDHYVGM